MTKMINFSEVKKMKGFDGGLRVAKKLIAIRDEFLEKHGVVIGAFNVVFEKDLGASSRGDGTIWKVSDDDETYVMVDGYSISSISSEDDFENPPKIVSKVLENADELFEKISSELWSEEDGLEFLTFEAYVSSSSEELYVSDLEEFVRGTK